MHQPTLRVLHILDYVSRTGGKRLADYSKALDIPKSTLLPILKTLCEARYLQRDENDYYVPGAALFSIGAGLTGYFPFLRFVRDELAALSAALGETCYCAVPDGGNVLYIEKAESSQPLRMLTDIGKRTPAYATGLGKVLLGGKTPQQLRALYPNGLKPLTERTVTDIDALARQVEEARLRGYAREIEESTAFITCFAVPVKKHEKTVAAISVAIPVFRFREEDSSRIVAALQTSAASIGEMMELTDAHFGDSF